MSEAVTLCTHHWIVRRSGASRCRDCGERKRFDPTPPKSLDLLPMFDPFGPTRDGTYNHFDPAMVGIAVSGGPRMQTYPKGPIEPFETVTYSPVYASRYLKRRGLLPREARNPRPLSNAIGVNWHNRVRRALIGSDKESADVALAAFLLSYGAPLNLAVTFGNDALRIPVLPGETINVFTWRVLRAVKERLRYALRASK